MLQDFTVYVLWSDALGRHYVGHTGDLERRLQEHRAPHAGFTGRAQDWHVVYRKSFREREAAARHESRIKKTGVCVFLASVDAHLGLSPAAREASEG